MMRMLTAVLAAGFLAMAAAPASAVDGHGNAANPERQVPNTGNVSGGPAHRDASRVSEAREKRSDGKPGHRDGDGHDHGHSHDKPGKK